MKRAVLFAAGAAIFASAPLLAPTALQAQTYYDGYTPAQNAFGQPDIQGAWSNATLTSERRPSQYGDRLVMTPEEVAAEEGEAVEYITGDNEAIDPDAPPPSVGGDLAEGQTSFSGAGGNVGGYDRGWLDPGSLVMRVGGEPRTSFLTTPNGQPPATVEGYERPRRSFGGMGGRYDNPETASMGDRCIIGFGRNAGPPMLPNGFYNNNYQIVQGKDAVIILVEMVHDQRIVRLNAEHRQDGVRPWFGDSIGWYEGNTLVVETTNFPQELSYNGSWENLTVTERFTRVADDRLHYAYTIEDPTMWAEPWGGEYEFHPLDGQIYEYACHEGNYALEGILAGERQAELQEAGVEQPIPLGRAQ